MSEKMAINKKTQVQVFRMSKNFSNFQTQRSPSSRCLASEAQSMNH
ncbi:hypothetical protein B6N60_00798 [Richelia sinica FACHB-800]|uniref:Uncharacterized protein n=1 Tax=Richelia sinica FACHB-800 TaxID=1357546 RepID=A0A975T4Q6_9NOST|nr:hypothetical protein B6N60_00798 [Richelia sinica FACHB-800]